MKGRRKFHLPKGLGDHEDFQLTKVGGCLPKIGKQGKSKKKSTSILTTEMEMITSEGASMGGKGFPSGTFDLISYNNEEDNIEESQVNKKGRTYGLISMSDNIRKEKSLKKSDKHRLSESSLRGRKKKDVNLKEIISRQKIAILIDKFIEKINRNNSASQPVQYTGFNSESQQSFWKKQAYENNKYLENTIGLLNILIVFSLIVSETLQLAFPELRNSTSILKFQTVSIFFLLLQIIYNLLTVKVASGKRLKTFEEVFYHQLQNNLVIDVINLLILVADVTIQMEFLLFLRLFIITKIPQCLEGLQKLEVLFIKNYYHQQHWSLVKVVLFNFCFAHVLAIILSAMAKIEGNTTWHIEKGISKAGWFPQYIWAYYWGVNIMLTVGFGDLSASNHIEALCLIFVEIISVMCLAYNINRIGTLICNIREQDIEKGKSVKTFKQLSDKYSLPGQLSRKISNYIEQSVNIRKKFNIQEEKCFIQSLPSTMKKQYLKESNKSIFQELPFFSNLVDKTLYAFAQKIEMSISHPEQILRSLSDDFKLLILREGEIGYTVKKPNCDFNNMVIDKVKIGKKDKPFIMSLQFLTRERPIYETTSLEYSVIYSLSYEDLIGILRESNMDYHLFCFLRDKNRSIRDEFEVFKCGMCKNNQKHTKFTCPKLHFTPYHQIVIFKENNKVKKGKNKRSKDKNARIIALKSNALKIQFDLLSLLHQKPIEKKIVNECTLKNTNNNRQGRRNRNLSYSEHQKIHQLSINLIKSAEETIKKELDLFQKKQNFEDQIWNLACDKVQNYKEYFKQMNACNLTQLYKVEERIATFQTHNTFEKEADYSSTSKIYDQNNDINEEEDFTEE